MNTDESIFKFLNICVHLWMLFLICAWGRVAAGGQIFPV